MKIRCLHHIGIAVNSIEKQMDFYTQCLGMEQETLIVFDPLQNVKVVLLKPMAGTRIELIEPIDETSPVAKILEQNSSLYHYCMEVDNMDATLAEIRKYGTIVVRPPVPATLFNGRNIAFVYTKHRTLIEFLER